MLARRRGVHATPHSRNKAGKMPSRGQSRTLRCGIFPVLCLSARATPRSRIQEQSWTKCRLGCSRKHYEIAFSQFCPGAPGCTGVPGCPGPRGPGGGAWRCPEVLPGTPGALLKLRASEDRSSSSLSWGPRGADGPGADLVFGQAGHAALIVDDILCTLPSPFFSSPSAPAWNS